HTLTSGRHFDRSLSALSIPLFPPSYFFLSRLAARDPRSFPTRRSSDLIKPPRDFSSCFQHMSCAVERKNPSVAISARLFGTIRSDRKSTRLNSSHVSISYAVFCLKKKINKNTTQ